MANKANVTAATLKNGETFILAMLGLLDLSGDFSATMYHVTISAQVLIPTRAFLQNLGCFADHRSWSLHRRPRGIQHDARKGEEVQGATQLDE
jgi:hypothetical protein